MSDARLELVEAAAFTALWEAAPERVRREASVRAHTVAGAVCTAVAAVPENTMINRVTGLGLHGAPSDAELDEIDAFFRDAGTRYAIGLSPFAPPELGARLEARGFEPGYAWMKFRRGVEPPPAVETALRVEEVGVEHGPAFGSVVARGYGLPDGAAEWLGSAAGAPGFRLFLAWAGDEPAGAGALFVGGGVGWPRPPAARPRAPRKGAPGARPPPRLPPAAHAGPPRAPAPTRPAASPGPGR